MKLMIKALPMLALLLMVVGLTGQLPAPQPVAAQGGVTATSCTFTSTFPTINLRSGPGIANTQVGTLRFNETLQVTGRAVGADLFIWWQGPNGEWVRSDLGTSDCDSLCGDGVCEYGETADSCSADCQGVSVAGITSASGCLVSSCQECYETVDCYPDCNSCTCDTNEFGCITCFCDYGTGVADAGVSTGVSTTSCTFTAARTVNLRAGAGTTFEVLDQIDANATLAVTQRAVGAGGYVWWGNADGQWVRSDLGDSDCDSLCGDTVCEIGETADTCAADCGTTG